MSHADSIKTALATAALLTGGIYTYLETGRQGIGRNSTSAAFDNTTGLLKPCAVIKQRASVPDGQIADDMEKVASTRTVVEVWLYQDGNGTPATLEAARNQVHGLLQGTRITGGKVRRVNEVRDFRDPALDKAQVIRLDYEVRGVE